VVLLSTSPRVSLAALQAWAELARDGAVAPDIPPVPPMQARALAPRENSSSTTSPGKDGLLRDYRSIETPAFEELEAALRQHGGNQSRAARALGLTPRQFAYRWRRHSQTLSNK
jgi:Nif-specific regulatory protein